jgi:ribosomal protein L21E
MADDVFDGLEPIFGAAREERRAEEEEYTRAALRQWARHRDLLDVVRELQHRGDTISLRIGDVVLVGTIDTVGRDYVQLRTDGGRVDVRLTSSAHDGPSTPVFVGVVGRARRGGRRAEADAASFRARLLEYDGDEIEAIVGVTTIGDELRGRLVVGRDHLVVRDREGGETYVPLGNVAWVRPWRE